MDLKNTNQLINNLNDQVILELLSLFTSEDKKSFYSRFSDLELLNRFIKFDKNASEHVADLNIDRKVELLNSSDKTLVEASSKVYDTISEDDKEAVLDKVFTVDGISALSEVTSEETLQQNNEVISEVGKVKQENTTINVEEEKEDIGSQTKEMKIDEEVKTHENLIFDFFKFNIQYYVNIFPVLKEADIDSLTFESILLEIITQIEKDYEVYQKQKEDKK